VNIVAAHCAFNHPDLSEIVAPGATEEVNKLTCLEETHTHCIDVPLNENSVEQEKYVVRPLVTPWSVNLLNMSIIEPPVLVN